MGEIFEWLLFLAVVVPAFFMVLTILVILPATWIGFMVTSLATSPRKAFEEHSVMLFSSGFLIWGSILYFANKWVGWYDWLVSYLT